MADAVVTVGGEGADRRLVAYVEPDGTAAVTPAGLAGALAGRLPGFMVPSAWAVLAALPRTANGKVDRRALPEPDGTSPNGHFAPPRTPLEERLAAIWSGLLQVERVGIHDSFFVLGGHSLLAVQVISRLREELGVELPLRALFEHPTVAALAAAVETRPGAPPRQPLVRSLPGEPRVLSFAQERIWLLDRLEAGTAAYNMPLALRLRGAFDPRAFAAAWNEVVRRHQVLRTSFSETPDGPVLAVASSPSGPLPRIDLSALPAGRREDEAARLTAAEVLRPFDLRTGAVLRALLLRLDREEHRLAATLHHVAGDAWSVGVLAGELNALYAAAREGSPSPLPELPVQYDDFARWQRERLRSGALDGELAWWRERFAGLPESLQLPAARPRGGVARRGGSAAVRLGPDLSGALRRLGRAEGATPFMILLAGFAALLARYTGQTDLCVGVPVAGRDRLETEDLLGVFLNTLALRTDLAGDPSFREVIGRVRETSLGALAHRELPFERLLEELRLERDLDRAPLFQVMFNLLNVPEARLDLPGVEIEPLALPPLPPKLDLTAFAGEAGAGQELELRLHYDAAIFEAAQMELLGRHLTAALAAAVEDPARRLSELPLAAAAAAAARMAPANDWDRFPPEAVEGSIPERFAAMARSYAGRPAVVGTDGEVWSYADLDRAADRGAAALLAALGGGAERVGVLLPQGAARIAGLLAALKAGKTCVPLDPGYPRNRLAFMVADAEAGAILTDAAHRELARELAPGVRLVGLGAEDAAALPLPAVPPETPAYILYTSGSTGEPKGVTQSHRNVLHHIRAYTDALRLAPGDRLSLLASFAFDAAVMDIFGALLNGAVLCPYDVQEEGTAGLPGWVAGRGITVFHATPTLYRRFLDEAGEAGFPTVRLVVLGGERCVRGDFERFRRHFAPEALFVNGLGPTESTLALQHFAARESAVERDTVPVGLPVAGTAVRLWNAVGEQAALYGVGEIAIGSNYLALGYWRRPELTAAAFLPDPAGGERRTYRTGDLGRWLPDGALEFVGRADFQVKVRGQRVELGEVEARLNALPGVREAVVTARQDASGDTRLAAYLLAPAPPAGELRRGLRADLPEAMIPATFTVVSAWPLTPTGKMDRAALPEPAAPAGAGEGEAPRTASEELVAGLFAEVLGVPLPAIGSGSDFFAVGGQSLLATRLVSRLRRSLGIELPLRAIFEAPTVAALAERIGTVLGDATAAPALAPLPAGAGAPLSFAQERLWFLDRLQPGSAAYVMPAAIRFSGALDVAALHAAFAEVVRRHAVLRATFADDEGTPVQTIRPPAALPLPLLDLSVLPVKEREAEALCIARAVSRRPFDLASGPLLRVAVVRLAAAEHLAVLALHHIAADGWSLGVLSGEVAALYPSLRAGSPPALPAPAIQYADFAAWQRAWLADGVLDRQLGWWRERLAGMPEVLELPADRPRPALPTRRGGSRPFALPAETAARLRDIARREGSTLFMLLLAAFQVLLHRLTGEVDLAVGTPVAGRTRVETEGLIGLFANTLVMRGDLSGDLPFRALLARTREGSLAAQAHQDLPFEKLVEALRPERGLDRSPLFQILFVLQNAAGEVARIPGLELRPQTLPAAGAKLDLSLALVDGPQGLSGFFEYAADLFDAVTVARWEGHFATLLRGLLEGLDRPLSVLPLITASERHQLRAEWCDTAVSDGRDGRCLHALLLAAAERTPEATAVVSADGELTYGELAARSRTLALRLRAAGAGEGSFVPLLLGSGPALVVAMLAAMRAGAAFVPLDVEWPAARLEEILSELAAPSRGIVLVDAASPALPAVPGRRAIRVDDAAAETPPGAALPGPGTTDPETPIYAIYTSGSTGRPKAAVIPHRGIVNRFLWMERRFGALAAQRVLQTTRCIYDSAVWQIFWPLTLGGRTVLTPPRLGLDPEALAGLVERHGITMVDFVPSIFNALVERLASGGEPVARLATLRAVVVGGEEMEAGAARELRLLLPGVHLVNLYGPTEASIGCICHTVGSELGGRVPIGRPIDNVAARVLDRMGNPVPIGIAGELGLAGRCAGQGYLGDPEKTRQAFVPDPLAADAGGPMYRTGDRVRWLPDGRLDFLGRMDRQVKIRGLRIEPGEIEAALRRHPRVAQAAILAVGASPAGRRLVAYVTPREAGASLGDPELRSFLAERLPTALVPAVFVVVASLPLAAGGKVDWRALAALAPEAAGREEAYVAPRTPAEELLAGIWSEVLGTGRPVGVEDDFFALGGHSLLAMRVVSRVRRTFGIELPVRALFERPTLGALARWLLADRPGDAPPPLAPVPRGDEVPLSFAQQRLWFVEQLQSGGALYNLLLAARLAGPLDAGRLAGSLREVVRRHEALRTCFPVVDGRPVQAIAPPGPVPLSMISLEGLPAGRREEELRRWTTAEARRRFDLAAGPLLRGVLLRLGERDHALLVGVHHTVCDGWSIGLLERELGMIYEASSRGVTPVLPLLPVQYADYAVWQRERLSGEALERELAWWKERLEGMPATLELPADRPRPAVQSFRGDRLPMALPAEREAALRGLGRRHGATLFMALLAAFDALLHRYTGEERLVVGTPAAGRTAIELEPLIGNFANTLVVPMDLGGNPPFGELLDRVRAAVLAVFVHQELPFELLVEALRPRRDLSHNPLFQILFGLHGLPSHDDRLGDLDLAPLPVESGVSRFDLSLDLVDGPGGLRGAFEYATGLFDRTTVERMRGHLGVLIDGVLAAPDTPLSELPLLTSSEWRQLLEEWNGLPAEAVSVQGLHALVEQQARRRPEAEAVVCGVERLTYRELDRRANSLAWRLRRLGVGPESRVGVHVERSVEMVVALLGVLKAGGVYVPLDPTYPAPRLGRILDGAAPSVVVRGRTAAALPAHAAAEVWLGEEESGSSPASGVSAANLAYVIYTSGSTGQPKGVQVSHGSVTHLMAVARSRFLLGDADVWTVFHSSAFDFSVWEIWGALALGGKLVIVPLETARSPESFRALLVAERVTVLNQTPSAVRALAEISAGAPSPSLRLLICGGEALPGGLVPRLLAWGVAVWNFYGPTEATVWAAAGRVGETACGSGGTAPLGSPLPGYGLYTVDRAGRALPAGVPGELAISGVGLARGYFGDPGLTAERFVPAPFAAESGARLYRTGDLARRREDGSLDYLGRIDYQVKVRGFRIELGEIEAVLRGEPAVSEAVIVARPDQAGSPQLVAYVVASAGEYAVESLRSHLRRSLPDYMVPSTFVRLESMPLSPNGKVDRSALPEPGDPGADRPFVAPRTPEEMLLASLWSELLGSARVGVRDNFFSLGGHSLLAVRLASRVRERVGVELPLRSVLETPTLEDLAERLCELRKQALPPLPEIVPAQRGGSLPLSFAQERLWFLDRFAPESSSLNLPAAVSLSGGLEPRALAGALSELVRRHEILRTRFETVSGSPFQAVLPARPISLPWLDLASLPAAARAGELERLKAVEAATAFDLEAGPPWSVRLVRLAGSEHVLLITLHHILSDGWSSGVMIRDLTVLYASTLSGEEPALPGLALQYADYAHWQRELLQGERLERELAYWRETLAGAAPLLDLPTDRPRPVVQTYRGGRWSTHLSADLTLRLRELGSRENATLFMMLLATFEVLAHRWSGQDDIVVGSPIAGRGRAELEPLIGLFLNSLVLRTDFSGDPAFRELLGRVRRTTLGAYSHQEVPFEKLLAELRPQRDLSRTPLFQVFFNLFNFPSVELAAPGLTLSAQPAAEAPAKFDLTVYVIEVADGIQLTWIYNRDLFDPSTIAELAGQLGLLAAQAVAHPEERIGHFMLITEAARAALPDPSVELSAEWMGAVHEVFSRQAARFPDRLAVSDPNERWTYGELAAQSNRLAHHLLGQDLRRGEVVAIYGHRSATLAWAVLGVLKAGGAFVILDPSYPPSRLLDCLRMAGPRGWIELTAAGPVPEAVRTFLEPLPAGLRIPLSPGHGEPWLAALPAADPGVPVGPEDVALIAFTSGSTGLPKGILGRQGPLSHFIPWQCRELGLSGDDRFSMLSGLAHDPLQRDIFTPLQIGGSLCIPDPEEMGAPGWLAGWMAREGITVAHLTPAMGQVLAEGAVGRMTVPSLRYAFLVGEALTRRDADRLRELAPNVTCVNFYGSTETQRSVGYFVVPAVEEGTGADRGKQVLPLGRGVADVQLLVCNRSGAQAGVGELGEIGVRSPHLAKGYLRDAALTAEKFIANPWRPGSDDRIYRTGDLGRYRADGNVVFAGRADHQVKIRGFRIELGEIEATLGLHPALQDVVAAVREDGPGEKRLVAYFVARPGEEPGVPELREYLRERLPHYMVPSAFVSLPALPLTPNRKLDRKALPAPALESAEERAGGAPLDAVEERLAAIWSEVLQGKIGRLDNFFDRGGHSLLATQLVARVRDAFGVELPLRSLFESPTVAGMAAALRTGQEGGLFAAALPRIVPSRAERHLPFPLTDVQEAYWIGRSGSFDLGTVATHIYFEVEGSRIDLDRFERVWRRLVERHDMLRAIVLPDGRQQILAEVPEYRIAVLDLAAATLEEAEAALLEVREEMSHQVLPSDRWPLFDLRASRLSAGRTRLHVSVDMLIGDALSFRILQREVLALYSDPEAVLEPLELSFRDYVVAVAGLEGAEVWQRSLAYWRERLKTLPPAPELLLAVSPSSIDRPRFTRMSGGLEPAVWERLKERAGRAGITPSGVLLAAFGELLRTWSKSPRFTINLTLFNRLPLHPQVQSVVGDFTSLTLLEIDTSAGESFEERARRLQGQLWSDLDHRHVSGVRVMRESRAAHGGTMVMPVVFTSTLGMPQAPAAALQELLDTRWVYGISQTSQVWLDHQAGEREGALRITWDAVEQLFPAGFLDAAFAAYLPFLHRLAGDEEAWRSPALSLLPADQLAPRRAANSTAGPVPQGLLHDGFLEQAALGPAAPAVISPARVLSYQELERRSLRLAAELRQRGARPGSLVAVVMEKGWEQVVAVLAVLRSGAAYLPVDPGLPGERLAYLLAQGEVEIALTQSWVEAELSWPEGVARLQVDTAAPADAAEPPLPPVQSAEDLAYVIFTSGSTGLPKGVMIDHRGALNTVLDVNRRFGVGPEDRVLALSALSFDLSVWDVFGTLAAGGAVVLPEPWAARDPGRWLELIAEHGVTAWNTVPALMELLVEYARGGGSSPALPTLPTLPTLRLVMMSGDWIPLILPPRIKALAPRAEIFGLGGATEASIWSNWYPASEIDPEWRSVPYGWPLTNQWFHVLDDQLRHRPTWVPGQLYIGGVGLAKGYWRDEEKTRGSFIEHPQTGERLYRTGDLGRYLPEGQIEFLGREDTQVKIQGFRIELGEIESALEQHPAVRSAVAAAAGEQRSDRRLVAYVVPGGEAPETAELRAFLAEKLPEHMLPASFVFLSELPLTANGKVDRKALPVPAASPVQESGFVAPRTPLEREVAALWSRVLGAGSIGLYDSLFDLGGNSLSAIQLVTQMRHSFHVEIPLRSLFNEPTVAGSVAVIHRLRAEREETGAPAFELPPFVPDPASRHLPFPLNDVQQAYWIGRTDLFDLGGVASHSYSEFEFPELEVERLELAFQRLIARHDMLRAVIHADGTQQILATVPLFRLPVIDLRGQLPETVEQSLAAVRAEMSHQVLAADRWPLFDYRVSLLDRCVRLHTSIDILLLDAWSSRIFWRELAELYRDPDVELPALELSFRDYVLAELALQETTVWQQAWKYWRDRLPTLPPAPELPLAASPSNLQKPRFVRRKASLPADLWGALKARGAQAGVTPSGLLLTAFSEILALWSKSARFTLNVTTFNRLPLHPQVNAIVGDFTSLTLLEVDASVPGGFELRARALQERLWEDLEHRSLGGVRVLRELGRVRGRTVGAMMPVVFTSTLFGAVGVDPAAGRNPSSGERVYGISQTPQVWLDHQVGESQGVLVFSWDAVEELFPAGLLDEMFTAYQDLLARLARAEGGWSDEGVSRLPEAQQAAWRAYNATEAAVPEGLLHGPFERRAALEPDRPAVVAPGRTLSYGELERLSGALASRLSAAGARPNRLVGVVMEKGWEQVVAVLAVVRAGGAYLPIDPGLPGERVSYLLRTGEVEVVLTQPWLESALEWPQGVRLLRVEAGLADGEEPGPSPVSPAVPEDLAYVIFTSGSTGVPKGVMTDHRGALNTVVDVNERFGVGPQDRVLALSSLSFDLSVYDVFGVLGAGGAVVLPEPSAARDPQRWAELIREAGVTVWNSVPALLEMLVEHAAGNPEGADLASLRLVMLSGDWIPVGLPDRLRALAPRARVISLGGATEASIWSILYPIERVDPAWKSIPYGRPMLNQRFWVLDGRLEPCPKWVPGQLYIGGVGLAKGYWKDEEKTRGSFIEHPRTGERLYRTGDLGRYLPEGQIEFLGREDTQVKIQGFRIELGEIEAALEQHPAVRAAVVAAVGEQRSSRRLVAYIVPEEAEDGEESPLPAGPEPPAVPAAGSGAAPGLPGPDAGRPAIELAPPSLDGERCSLHRQFIGEPVPLDRLGELLSSLRQARLEDESLSKYRYPSAGHLYPVQVYLQVPEGRVAGLSAGLYYYHPVSHQLLLLQEGAAIGAEIHSAVHRPAFEAAAFSLFLVGHLAAIEPVYGAQARDFCLLEAGYMLQLLLGVAPAAGLGLCPVGSLDFERLRSGLELDGGDILLHSLLAGPVAADAADAASAPPHWQPAPPEEPPLGRPAVAAAAPARRLDEVERLEFKLAEHGIRNLDGTRPRVRLSPPELDEARLQAWRERRSHRRFLQGTVSFESFSRMLGALTELPSAGSLPSRRYPSAAGLYPVQVYLHVKPGRVDGVAAGTYLYRSADHGLVRITERSELDRALHAAVNQEPFEGSAFSLFLVASPTEVQARYGELARDLCLLEAGAMGQLLMAVAPSLGIGFCPVGNMAFSRIRSLFNLREDQLFLHALLGGAPDATEEGAAQPGRERARILSALGVPIAEIQTYLRGKLPDYMVPPAFVVLDRLPLTANGKVDRQALPAPESGGSERGVYAEPRDAVEGLLADLWVEVLRVPRVGIHDNFFDLGGDSILGLQIVSRANRAGIALTPRDIFEHQTIADLAQVVAGAVPAAAAETAAGETPPQDGTVPVDLPSGFDEDDLDRLMDNVEFEV